MEKKSGSRPLSEVPGVIEKLTLVVARVVE
jgi:hypothetical protein